MTDTPVWRRVTEATVLRAWAVAEATSAKEPLGKAVAEGRCPPEMRDKLLAGRHRELTEAEWQALVRAVLQARGPLLQGLLDLRPEWYEGKVPIPFVEQMFFFNLPAWVAKTPSRNLGDLAGTRHQSGNEPEFRGFFTDIERPIAVGPSLDGPFCLVEGYTRCGCLVRDHRAGLSILDPIPILVGISPRIAEWSNGQGHLWW